MINQIFLIDRIISSKSCPNPMPSNDNLTDDELLLNSYESDDEVPSGLLTIY